MKRDWDVIRKALIFLESSDSRKVSTDELLTETQAHKEFLEYQLELMVEAGLLTDPSVKSGLPEARMIFDTGYKLTWSGHEFLDKIRSDTVWNQTKQTFTQHGLSLTVDLIGQVAGGILKKMLGLPD